MNPGSSADQPILVTGAPRTGTTWIGHILAQAPRVAYMHEPLNVDHDRGLCGVDVSYTFPYICEQNERRYLPHLRETLQLRYRPLRALLQARSLKQLRLACAKSVEFRRHQRKGSRPLMKDPIAVFSADWLSRRFGMATVVVVRHPAGFARSYMTKQWTHPFGDFLAQPMLIENRLAAFEDEIRFFAEREQPVIDQAALLWKLVYADLAAMQRRHPEWLFVRYEDICDDPQAGFNALFDALGLEYSARVRTLVTAASSPGNADPDKARADLPENIQKKSSAVARAWQQEMSASDLRRLRKRVGRVADRFYADSEW